MTRTARVVFVIALASVLTTGCHRPKKFEADVEITRMSVVRRDDQGKPQTLDLEISYFACPGTQIEVMRGGPEFAACVLKHKVGDKVHVGIEHVWDPRGYYRNNVVKVGECTHAYDPDDEASFLMVRECEDWTVNGAKVGFKCNYTPEKTLLKQCPWFARR
jgi:hypothetical protein